jgi:hypothetical protein
LLEGLLVFDLGAQLEVEVVVVLEAIAQLLVSE